MMETRVKLWFPAGICLFPPPPSQRREKLLRQRAWAPRDTLGHGRRAGIPLGQECSLQVSTVPLPPIVILVSQGMRVLYFVETICLRAGAMAQINYDEDWESGVENQLQ